MRVLVLGATGFLGSNACRSLERNSEVELVRHASHGTDVALDLTRADTGDLVKVLNLVRADAVVNCVGLTVGGVERMRSLNIDAVRHLVAAMREVASAPRLVHIGSAAEYGAGQVGIAIAEDVAPRPVSAYGRSKLSGTATVLEAAELGDIEGVVLRVFNPVGAGMAPGTLPAEAAMQLLTARATNAQTITLGRLDDFRDYVDAEDVGDAVASAVVAPALTARVINVGSGRATQNRKLVEELVEATGYQGGIVEARTASSRSSSVHWQCADISRARLELGWTPDRPLRHSVAQLLAGAEERLSQGPLP